MKIVITIPTYNEAANIAPLIEQLELEFKKMLRHDFFILVLDDSSPDGTADVVRGLSKKYPNVSLLLRTEKSGLGTAYLAGFDHAINIMSADVVVEMDADFQHDPKDVLRLIEEIDKGADYVIGSRFTKGGSIPKEWGIHRKFLSRGGNLFSKIVLGMWKTQDFTSGFKASRVKGFMEKIKLSDVKSKGFAYKIDLLYRMHKLGAKTVEVPIEFGLRDRGNSKMEISTILDSFLLVLRIRATEYQSFLLFLVVGSIGLAVDLMVFNLIIFLDAVRLVSIDTASVPTGTIASLVSGFIAMFTTFMLNNRWTFGDRKVNTASQFALSILTYYLFSYVPIVFRSWLVRFMVLRFGDTFLVNNLALFVGIFVGLVWNFTVYSKLIWKRQHNKVTGV